MFLKMQKKYTALVIVGILLILSGCSAPKGMIEAVKSESATPLVISDLKYNETMKEGKVDLVEFNFTFPQIDNPNENSFINEVNQSYTQALEEQKAKGASENLAMAKENYEFAKGNPEAIFSMNGYQINYTVTTNDGNVLSVFQMFSEFTGGAHPFTYFKAQNFDIKAQKSLALKDLMGLSEEETKKSVLEQVYKIIEAQEASEGIIYYESYKSDCATTYNPEHFYLKDGKIIFFYQAYDIAPYAAGLREFEVNVN